MDFVLGLPKTRGQHDSILVVVDHFLKMTHFIQCANNFDAYRVATIFLEGILKLHALPKPLYQTWLSSSQVTFEISSSINCTRHFNSLLRFILKQIAKLK